MGVVPVVFSTSCDGVPYIALICKLKLIERINHSLHCILYAKNYTFYVLFYVCMYVCGIQ